MNNNKLLKKTISKIAFITTIISAVVINEQILINKIKKQKEKFEAEKELLEKKISQLEEKNKVFKDTSFRFYKVLRNDVDFDSFEKIYQDSFVYDKENVFEKYRQDTLSKELILDYDSLDFEIDRKQSDDLLKKELDAFDKFKESDSIENILENGQNFLNLALNVMRLHNRSIGNSLIRILDNSDEQNDREYKARYFMFKVKGKNKVYASKYDLMADYYRLMFIKNVSEYKKTTKYMNSIVDSLTNEYNIQRENDSIAFEIDKNNKIDSLFNSPKKNELLKPYEFNICNLDSIIKNNLR